MAYVVLYPADKTHISWIVNRSYMYFVWSSNVYHHSDVVMGAMASQITGVSIVYSIVCSDADQRKHQSPASLAFVRGIHRWPVNSPHRAPATRKKVSIWWYQHGWAVSFFFTANLPHMWRITASDKQTFPRKSECLFILHETHLDLRKHLHI